MAELIVALDVATKDEACALVDLLSPRVKYFKVGSLFTICGPQIIDYIKEKGGRAFLDMKWLDIPNTVYNFVSAGTGMSCEVKIAPVKKWRWGNLENKAKKKTESGVFMMSVHVREDQCREMLVRAKEGAENRAGELGIKSPSIVGITVLTSENHPEVKDVVLHRADIAQEAGLDGAVCSAHEAAALRKQCGDDFLIVVPGIRLKRSPPDDQKRKATVADAVKAGANYIVVGRPIIKSKNPKMAAEGILKELREAH
ncbi:orotidine-5'-phosphate decarboxylase [Candidatus Omnitrophota bacterium]